MNNKIEVLHMISRNLCYGILSQGNVKLNIPECSFCDTIRYCEDCPYGKVFSSCSDEDNIQPSHWEKMEYRTSLIRNKTGGKYIGTK